MNNTTASEVIRNYHVAWTSGDIESAMQYVADDIACRAPGVDLEGKEQYRAFIGGFAPMLTAAKKHLPSGSP